MRDANYPLPLDAHVSKCMRANGRRNTRPERRLRSLLYARGLRYRVNHRIATGTLTVRPDVIFVRARVAVFVDGCFWHACPEHGNTPQRNKSYWGPKLERNARRDKAVSSALKQAGWLVVRAWEHEEPAQVADRVALALVLGGGASGASAQP